jgi:hypothetical protein
MQRQMAPDPESEQYDSLLPRPEAVQEWFELEALLGERAERLMVALGSGLRESTPWQVEGPLFEAGQLSIGIDRPLRSDPQKEEDIHLVISLGIEVTDDPAPPDPLRLSVYIAEENQFVSQRQEQLANLRAGVAVALASVAGYLVWRAVGGLFLPVLTGVGSLIGLSVIDATLRREPPRAPSPEFLALVETVQGLLAPTADDARR